MGFIPLSKRRGIDLDDGTLDECVCADKFVVRGVVHLHSPKYQNRQSFLLSSPRTRAKPSKAIKNEKEKMS